MPGACAARDRAKPARRGFDAGVHDATARFGRDAGTAADLRGKYPEDTFYRRDGFRPDFATYADQTVCTAQGMIDLTAPDARFAGFDATLDAALGDLIAHTRAGRAAVRARNVSEYRDWYRGVDARIAAVRNAVGSQP